MATNVFANGHEISCKAASGKTSVAFPDPCWSPPPPPAGPIILPYPNTAKPSSLKKGSVTVLIKNSAIALTDRSYFSTSTGDEPATQAFQKGVLTRKLKGKTYYKQWSMNVKVEGKGVCRNIDLMTHNHGSFPGNTATFPYIDSSATGELTDCVEENERIKTACEKPEDADEKWDWTDSYCPDLLKSKPMSGEDAFDFAKQSIENAVQNACSGTTNSGVLRHVAQTDTFDSFCQRMINKVMVKEGSARTDLGDLQFLEMEKDPTLENDCLVARKCMLVPYDKKGTTETAAANGKNKVTQNRNVGTAKATSHGCCPGQTGHHLVYNTAMSKSDCSGYDGGLAPTVCAESVSYQAGSHKLLHEKTGARLDSYLEFLLGANPNKPKPYTMSLKKGIQFGSEAFIETYEGYSECSPACITKQLENYYYNCGCSQNTKLEITDANGYSRK